MSSLPHPYGQPRKLRRSCDFCTTSKLKCSQEKPACQRCVRSGREATCFYSETRPPGRPKRPTSRSFDDINDPTRQYHQHEMSRSGHSISSLPDSMLQTLDENDPDERRKRPRLEDIRRPETNPVCTSVGLSVGGVMGDDFANMEYDASASDSDIFDLVVDAPESENAGCSADAPDCLFDDFDITWVQTNMSHGSDRDVLAMLELDSYPSLPPSMVTPESMITEPHGSSDKPFATSVASPWELHLAQGADRNVQVDQRPLAKSCVLAGDADHFRQLEKDDHSISQEYTCEWSKSISELTSTLLAPQASYCPPAHELSLDTLLKAEQTLLSVKQNTETSNTPNAELIVCSLMSLWLSKLKAQLGELYNDEPDDRIIDQGHRSRSGEDMGSRLASLWPEMHVGGSKLPKAVMRDCVRVMLKRRLRNHIQIFSRTMQAHSESRKALVGSVRLATTAIVDEVESLLGMLNM